LKIPGVSPATTQPFFREFALRLNKNASDVLARMASDGVLGGLALTTLTNGSDPSCEDTEHVVLVTVTERRTKPQVDHYVELLTKALK
jgi:glycine cleavage system pyridoxal-binding protein P